MNWHWKTIATVWVLAIVGAVLTVIFASADSAISWIGLTLAGCTIATLCLQIFTGTKEGYVSRVILSVTGAIVILVFATAIVALT